MFDNKNINQLMTPAVQDNSYYLMLHTLIKDKNRIIEKSGKPHP